MGREITLRQLIFKCNKELFKEQGLTRSELHDLTTYVLSTAAVSKLTEEELYISEGNSLGLGVSNYDREITLPRFLVYEFDKLGVFEFLGGNQRTYRLKSFSKFDELESHLKYSTSNAVVVIDGEITEYQKVGNRSWGWEIVWGCDAYLVTFTAEDTEHKEVLKSKEQ
mgnify:FL=1